MMIFLYKETFNDFELVEFPYDENHSAIGEYHHYMPKGYMGNWYDPISLHQYRSCGGSWLITSDGKKKYLEQNRSNIESGFFEDISSMLILKDVIYSDFTFSMNVRNFDIKNYCGMVFNYISSRNFYSVSFDEQKIIFYKKHQDELTIIEEFKYQFDDLKNYNIKVEVTDNLKVYLNNKLVIESIIKIIDSKCGIISKGASRFFDIDVYMTDESYSIHQSKVKDEEKNLLEKQNKYSKLEVIHRIDLKNFGTGRHMRIAKKPNGEHFFIFAQHQKRIARDSFAHISCLTAVDLNSKILWQKGYPNNHENNTLISCDLPFQVSDINNDGIEELIYACDFELIICNAYTGELIKKMPTPKVSSGPFTRLNVDALRVADFSKKGYQSDIVLKDRYENVWAYDYDFNLLWHYKHKNTGHFPYVADFYNKGCDYIFIGYDMVDNSGNILWSLPINSDHTDEIIFLNTHKNSPKRLYLASGNEGFNIVNTDGSIYKSINVGHAQRISIANYNPSLEGHEICVTSFWGNDGIVYLFDYDGNLLVQKEFIGNGNVITPVNYDGTNTLILTNSSNIFGGLLDSNLDVVVKFEDPQIPSLCTEALDIDCDGIDEILCWDQNQMVILKAKNFKPGNKYDKYPDNAFSNYRGEFSIKLEN